MKKNSMITKRHHSGFNLVELMVALALGLVVMLGVLQVLVNIMRSYRLQNALNHLNENGQYVLTYLARDLRDAGFAGCLSSLSNASNGIKVTSSDSLYPFYNFSATDSGPVSGTKNTPVAGFDTLYIRGSHVIGTGARLTAAQATTSSTISISSTNAANLTSTGGQLLLVSDCQQGDLFNSTLVSGGAISHAAGSTYGNTAAAFSSVYDTTATVYNVYTYKYDVTNAGELQRTSATGNVTTVLPLIANVKGFVVYYGLDTDGDLSVNQYIQAPMTGLTTAQLAQVVSLRFELLLASDEDNLLPAAQGYYFNYTQTTPTDKRLYRVYRATVALKNTVK